MNTRNRDYSLDVLKIVAMTLLVFHHYQQGSGAVFKYINFWDGRFYFGYLVELFFVLSGMFVYKYIDKVDVVYTFKTFYISKAVRLLPLLSLSVIVEALIYLYNNYLGNNIEIGLWQIIVNALGIQNGWMIKVNSINGPTWYVSILMLCYLVFYVLTFWAKKFKISAYYLYLLPIIIGLGISAYGIDLPFLTNNNARGYIAFFTGIFLSKFYDKYKIYKKQIIGVSSCVIVLFVSSFLLCPELTYNGLSYLLTFLVYPAIILIFRLCISRFLCKCEWLGILGAISFNVYIWHEPLTALRNLIILQCGLDIDLTTFSSMIIFTLIVWICGSLSYFFIEKPLYNFLKNDRTKIS